MDARDKVAAKESLLKHGFDASDKLRTPDLEFQVIRLKPDDEWLKDIEAGTTVHFVTAADGSTVQFVETQAGGPSVDIARLTATLNEADASRAMRSLTLRDIWLAEQGKIKPATVYRNLKRRLAGAHLLNDKPVM